MEPPNMPTPQILASAPEKFCPKCGRRMQHLSSSNSTHHYACYAHTLQNTDTTEPFYLNVHFTFKVGADGKLLTKDGVEASAIPPTERKPR